MKRLVPIFLSGCVFAGLFSPWLSPGDDEKKKETKPSKEALANLECLPSTVTDARGRARLLFEAIHGALQVMHRDFFSDDEKMELPSQSLQDVFAELERTHHVQLHWLAVDAKVMDEDHVPRNRFEENVIIEIGENKKSEVEAVQGDTFRYAGRVKLGNSCLKCHLPNRTSLEDRSAALVISIPLKKK